MNLIDKLDRFFTRLLIGIRRIEQDYEHHILEINKYLVNLWTGDCTRSEALVESSFDYLENYLPGHCEYFRKYASPQMAERFERKNDELRRDCEGFNPFIYKPNSDD